MPKYNTAKYKIGDIVTIISSNHSSPNSEMIDMIGKQYLIQGIPDHTSCIINEFYWSSKDIKKFIKPTNQQKKIEKFDVNNLVIESEQI